MPDALNTPGKETRDHREPTSSNHVIWGMTIGILLGSALGFLVFDNVGVGVAGGIVLGGLLSTIFFMFQKR